MVRLYDRGQAMSHAGIPVCSECGAAFDLASLTTNGCAQTGLCYACLSVRKTAQKEQIAREMSRLLTRHKRGKQEALFDE